MSKFTLDEAIKHCLEVAEQNDAQAEKWREEGGEEWGKTTTCRECAADHRQLAEWLMELKDLRAEQNDQYVFIHELMNELKEAKRLLKAAVEAMKGIADNERAEHVDEICCGYCDYDSPLTEYGEMLYECPGCDCNECFKWKHEAEALALIGRDTNVPAREDDENKQCKEGV